MYVLLGLLVSVARAAKVDEVMLTWAWPSGLDLPVRVDVREVVTAGTEPRRRCFSVEARLRSQQEAAGLRVWFTDAVDVLPGDECPQFVELRPVLPPGFVVDGSGAVTAVDGRERRDTDELWNRAVGFWAGRTARREAERARASRATPALGWEVGPVEVSCALTDVDRRAEEVELSLSLTPDPVVVTDYFTRLHATALELGGTTVGGARLTETTRVVVDPRTLLPLRWTEVLLIELTMADPPGSARREVETRWSFGAEPGPRGERKTDPR